MKAASIVELEKRGARPRGEQTRQKILHAPALKELSWQHESLPLAPEQVDYKGIREEIRRMTGWIVGSD